MHIKLYVLIKDLNTVFFFGISFQNIITAQIFKTLLSILNAKRELWYVSNLSSVWLPVNSVYYLHIPGNKVDKTGNSKEEKYGTKCVQSYGLLACLLYSY